METQIEEKNIAGCHQDHSNPSGYCISALDSVKHIAQQTLAGSVISSDDPRLRKWFDLDGKTVTLPGQGVVTSPLCGTVQYVIACPNKDSKPVLRYHNCHKITCPVCYHWAVNQQTRRIEDRLLGLDEAYKRMGLKTGQWKHIVVSDNPDKWPPAMLIKDNGKSFKKKCRQALKESAKNGFWGGVEILHAYRKKHDDGTECENDECKKHHVWKWGPHCHYITKGFFLQSDQIYQVTGLMVKNIRPGQSRDVGATSYYLLTHSAVFTEHHQLIDSSSHMEVPGTDETRTQGLGYCYVGAFATNKGAVVTIGTDTREALCPKCNAELHRYDVDLTNEIPLYDHDQGVHTIRLVLKGAYLITRKSQLALDGVHQVWFEKGEIVHLMESEEDT